MSLQQQQRVYTPKAVILLTRIKRNLAGRGVHGDIDSWDYEEMKSLCEQWMDDEIKVCLQQLADELDEQAAPGAWGVK